MSYVITSATQKILKLKKRIRAIQGGTAAGKTIGILEVLISLCQTDTKPTLTSVVSESFPHLKRGVIRDFLNILEEQGYFNPERWNKTDYVYTFETGSKLEFFSADQPSKVRGPRRQRLFINEANNVPFETFEQLEVRTEECIYLDWNPTSEFWFYTELLHKRDDIDHLILTYKDNEALSPEIVRSIETRRERAGWWKVYGLGELGEVDGKIYKDWQIIDEVPHTARLERRGLDFGFSNDPTTLVAIYYHDGGYIWDEELYQTGILNKQIGDTILNQVLPKTLVIGDSAEPKSIAELKLAGVNIVGVAKTKGDGSSENFVKWSIDLVQNQKISVTKRSVNIIREYRNYLWETDRDGKILNVPEHQFSHTMDAGRYAMVSILKKPKATDFKQSTPVLPYYPELGL